MHVGAYRRRETSLRTVTTLQRQLPNGYKVMVGVYSSPRNAMKDAERFVRNTAGLRPHAQMRGLWASESGGVQSLRYVKEPHVITFLVEPMIVDSEAGEGA